MGSNADSIDIGFRAQQLAELDNTIEVNDKPLLFSHPIERPLDFLMSALSHICTLSPYQLVDQRESEITGIARSIEELEQIFKELAVLVIDQGTILDRIDYNMEIAVERLNVRVGPGCSGSPDPKPNRITASTMRCFIALVVLIAIMLIVLVVKNSPQKSSN